MQKVQREAQGVYDAAVAAGEDEEALPPRVIGVCVGRGEAMGLLEGADGVVCVGWKEGEDLARVVASSDIMVAPSEVHSRSMSNRYGVAVAPVSEHRLQSNPSGVVTLLARLCDLDWVYFILFRRKKHARDASSLSLSLPLSLFGTSAFAVSGQ